jgi:hypothetical protein
MNTYLRAHVASTQPTDHSAMTALQVTSSRPSTISPHKIHKLRILIRGPPYCWVAGCPWIWRTDLTAIVGAWESQAHGEGRQGVGDLSVERYPNANTYGGRPSGCRGTRTEMTMLVVTPKEKCPLLESRMPLTGHVRFGGGMGKPTIRWQGALCLPYLYLNYYDFCSVFRPVSGPQPVYFACPGASKVNIRGTFV